MAKKYKTIDGKRYYRQAFAIPGDPDKPETWKLPHHVSGDKPHDELGVDWGRAEAAAVAAQSGQFRGQRLQATMAERKRAARHLAAHYRKAEKDVPEGLAKFIGAKKERRQVGPGTPLEEAVKGSYEYFLGQLRRAFWEQFVKGTDSFFPFIIETFVEHLIVKDKGQPEDEFYLVQYAGSPEAGFSFAERGEWELVELTYKPRAALEESGRRGKERPRRFNVRIVGAVSLEEKKGDGPRYISGIGLTADVVNGNGRRYPSPVVRAAVRAAQAHLHESLGQGKVAIVGEAEHPSDKGQRPRFLETIVRWEELGFDEGARQVTIRGRVLDTTQGKDAVAIMEGGVMPDVSMRGYGKARRVEEDGTVFEEVTELTMTAFDLLSPGEQSDPGAGIDVLESKQTDTQRRKTVNIEEFLEALKEEGLLDALSDSLMEKITEAQKQKDRERQEKMLREALEIGPEDDLIEAARRLKESKAQEPDEDAPPAQTDSELEASLREELDIGETDDLQEAIAARDARLKELEEAEEQRKVAAFIEKAVAELKYPEWLQKQFVEAIQATKPGDVETARATIQERRKEYDAIQAKLALVARGHPAGMEVLGPVLESELGVPAFARASFEITEALARRELMTVRDLRTPRTINERFAAEYLAKFDALHKHHLVMESRMLEEAEQASDLNLPYSTDRTVIAAVFPALVSTGIFDVGMTDQQSTRVYYEAYSGETGAHVAVTDEDVTSDEGAWVDLAYKHVEPGTVVVEPDGGGTAYVEGTDYVIDYLNGKFWTISAANGGSIGDATALDVDYHYEAVRLGEMVAIERGKGTLSYTTLEMAADRLATEISTEAVLFSRSQIGWDARARTLAMLVREIRKFIDRGLIYLALAASLKVASNSGGTWASSSDPISELVEKIGYARVKVANRYYDPTAILLSVTNSDRVANWEGFAAAGVRPDADLNANGFVGRLKGLPCFESTEMSDSYVLTLNREVVHHRVYQPMQLKGPYPSYSSNKLVASEQYYAEEFNGSDAPVPEKASHVVIT